MQKSAPIQPRTSPSKFGGKLFNIIHSCPCKDKHRSKGLLPDLGVIRPTVFIGVPKVYENVRDAVKRKMTGVKATLLDKALSAKIDDFTSGAGYMKLWDTLVFNKTKAALGGRVRIAVSGGAPISQDTKFDLTLR